MLEGTEDEIYEAGAALDHLIGTVQNHALGEYFLKQAEEQVTTYPVVVLCPAAYRLHIYGTFKNPLDADQWLDHRHFNPAKAFGGNTCNSDVDYDMHAVLGLETTVG